MKTPVGVLIFISILLLLDFYVFQSVKAVTQHTSQRTKNITYIVYWSVSVLSVLAFFLFVYTDPSVFGKKIRAYLFGTVIGLFLSKMVAATFFLLDDIRRFFQWIAAKLFFSTPVSTADISDSNISRSAFLSWLGIFVGSTLFGSLLVGYRNKYNYKVSRQKLSFDNLPSSFKGLKIVHISDIHCGSFTDIKAVEKGIRKIMNEQPDLILFTGDLVNDKATETDEYKNLFARLNAPLGVFSVFGNHDYGDYIQWPVNGISKQENLENLKKVHAEMGWRLLLNEHAVIEKGEHQLAIIGIENWSAKARFPKYGKMHLAYDGAEKYPFKILLSHDPSHWQAEVREKYADIDLMLSGHTHGMQFGLEIPGVKWSPIQYMYKEWAGLYEAGKQKLYVNRGFGFLGYPGRMGILPEITVLELV